MLVAALALLGGAGGVLLGHLTKLAPAPPRPPVRTAGTELELDSRLRLAIGPGDKFPPEYCTLDTGEQIEFDSILLGHPTVLFFWHLDCPTCMEQAILWNTFMEPHLKSGVNQVACLQIGSGSTAMRYPNELQNKTIVYIDYERFERAYNLVVYPIIMAIDGDGQIVHVQYEYSALFDEQLAGFVTDALD